jgi:glyoxylase-like metal-dependent hydrolase (beta-lactamase superfamily II)
MKRWALLGVIPAAGILAAYLGAERPPEYSVERLADNLVVIKDDNDGNTAVFIRNDGVVLVDTKSLKAGRKLLEVLKTVTAKPVTHILHTHHHYDHTGGNSSFPAAVEVIAHENAAARMPAMEEFNTPERKHGLPDRTFKDTLTLFSGAEAIEMYYFGPAHTDNDAFIVFRGAGIMHAGDTAPGMNAVARHGGSAERYSQTMNGAAAISGVRTVIPGHGPLMSWEQFVDNVASLAKRQ